MRRRLVTSALALGVGVAGATPALAETEVRLREARLYLRTGLGAGFAGDLDQRLTYDPSVVVVPAPATGKQSDLGSGFAYAGAIGFQYPGRTRTELEYRRMGATLNSVVYTGGAAPVAAADDAVTAQSLMSNVYVDFLNASPLTPFVGAGIGGARITNERGERDAAFAWQLRAGLEADLGSGLSLGAEYTYFRTREVSFGPKNFPPGGPAGPRTDDDGVRSSIVMATLRKSF